MARNEEDKKLIVPKAPKQKIRPIQKKISYINLMEADDNSESSQEEIVSISPQKIGTCKDDGYLSDDRYEDSFDEKYGDGCETNPDSGNAKIILERNN